MAEESMTTRIEVVGAEEAKRTLADFFQAYKTGKEDVKTLNTAMREQAGTIYGARRALMLMRTEWRMQHAAWIEGARVMRDIGRIGRNITQMWQAYTIGMIRVESAQRDLRQATMDVTTAQERYNKYLEIFGEDSIYTITALNDVKDAEEAVEDATRRANDAARDFSIGLGGLALQGLDFIATLPMLAMHLKMVASTLGITKTSITGVTTAITALGATATAVLLGLPALAAGVAIAFDQLIRATTPPEVLEAYTQAKAEAGGIDVRGGVLARRAAQIEPEIVERMVEASGAARGYTRVLAGYTEEQMEARRRTYGGRGGQFGIPRVPETGWYYLHREEEVKASVWTGRRGRGERGVTVRQVSIYNYFGDVTGALDLERAGEISYRKLMRKLETIR